MKLSLYHYPSCPFCRRVFPAIEQLGGDVELRDILAEPQHGQELVEATGRTTVPCLRIESDDDSVEWLHESRDIIRYLQELGANGRGR